MSVVCPKCGERIIFYRQRWIKNKTVKQYKCVWCGHEFDDPNSRKENKIDKERKR